jgi:hypothetical protein
LKILYRTMIDGFITLILHDMGLEK